MQNPRLELNDGRGQFRMPTPEQVEAANLDSTGISLFAAVEAADQLVIQAAAAVESAKADVATKLQAVADAQAHRDRLMPKVSAVSAVRAFISTGQRN
jgi:hypothetical protein